MNPRRGKKVAQISHTKYRRTHIPRQITDGLRRIGVDVLTAQEDGFNGSTDPILLDRATELQRVLFSQDQDLPIEAQRRQVKDIYFAGIIYARQRYVSIGDCVRDLEIIAKAGNIGDFANRVQYLPL